MFYECIVGEKLGLVWDEVWIKNDSQGSLL